MIIEYNDATGKLKSWDEAVASLWEISKLEVEISVLERLLPTYSGKTIDNIIDQLKSRVKYKKERVNDEKAMD